MNVNPFSLIGDKIDRKDIFAEYKGIMGDDIPSLDFNDYTTNGWYESTGTNRTGSANVPHASDNGYLLVVSKSRTVYQYWYSTYQSLGTMVRARKNGTWGSWTAVALTSDLSWNLIQANIESGTTINFDATKYHEIMIVPMANGNAWYNPFTVTSDLPSNVYFSVYQDGTYHAAAHIVYNSGIKKITYTTDSVAGWARLYITIYAR